MNNDFQEILTSILEEYQNNGSVNSVVEKMCKEEGLTAEECTEINKINDLLDAFAEKAASLETAGDRQEWIKQEVDAIANGRSEEEKAMLMDEISKIEDEALDGILTQE